MSDAFARAYSATMQREGGYVNHNVANDRGGQTYAGISRRFNPAWEGWAYLDRNETPPTDLVRMFYHLGYWLPIHGDQLRPDIAASIYDFAVNTSAPRRPTVAVKLAQAVAQVEPDGVIGPKSVAALNAMDTELFHLRFFAAKVKRYAAIANKDATQRKFMLGWVNRALSALEDKQ